MAETSIKRHPIRAVLWGIVGGVGVTMFLIGRAVIPFGKWTAPIIIILIVVALNLLWAYLAPPRKPKGPAPDDMQPEPIPTMANAGFEEPGFDTAGDADDSEPSFGLGPPPSPPTSPPGESDPEDPTRY